MAFTGQYQNYAHGQSKTAFRASIEVQTLCWKLRLALTEKMVLICMAAYAEHDGTGIYVTVNRMAEECGISDRAVQLTIKKLIARDILVMINPGCGRNRSTEYAIDLDEIERLIFDQALDVGRTNDPQRRRLPQSAWNMLRAEIFQRDNFTCSYCGVVGGKLHCDHVIPISRGGSNAPENLTTACAGCNIAKKDRTADEWLSSRAMTLAGADQ